MRFPLSLTLTMAGYIVRKKLTAHETIPARADARAAARLQPDLHRLRPHPRIFDLDQGKAHGRRMPGGGGRSRRADRLDLRRRADDLSADSASWSAESCNAASTSILCTNGMFITQAARTNSGRRAGSSSTCTSTAWKRRTTRPSSATASSGGDRGHQGRQEGRLPGLHEHDDLSGNRPRARSIELFAFLTKLKVDNFMLVAGLRLHGRASKRIRPGRPRSS